jgi:hypothetical protein
MKKICFVLLFITCFTAVLSAQSNLSEYFVIVNGRETGPFNMDTLKSMVQNRTLTRTSLVWKERMRDWQEAITVDELKSLFPPPPPLPPTPYKIGDKGPAGGIVFFDRGFIKDGWRYLEVAPANTELELLWGVRGTNIAGTSTEVGFGEKNTEILLVSSSNLAAQMCGRMEYGGCNDWFLPSRDELFYIYRNLASKGLGGFKKDYYWSSSQNDNNPNTSYCQRFDDGYQTSQYKDNTYFVRAIRGFP